LRRAVFVDRDGVLNALVPDPVSGLPESPLEPELVTLMPGAARALQRLHDRGYVLVGVSNQPAAAKGVVSLEQLCEVQARVLELLGREGAELERFELCFHHPHGVDPELSAICDCRKPRPGMVLGAARALTLDLPASWLVGDTDDDVAAGAAAGCRTVLVENPGSGHKRHGIAQPDLRARDLSHASELILRAAG
jgi:D-glycero-D-manno-heptose 1,7-bisphosphate phosphatase